MFQVYRLQSRTARGLAWRVREAIPIQRRIGYGEIEGNAPLTISVDLAPDVERALLARADARGVMLTEYVSEVVAREAGDARPAAPRTGQALIDVCAQVRGLLSDEETDTLFARSCSQSRPLELPHRRQ